MGRSKLNIRDIGKTPSPLTSIEWGGLAPLPPPYDRIEARKKAKVLDENLLQQIDGSLDGTIAVGMARPASEAEEEQLIERFLAGLQKLVSRDNNWGFLQQLTLSLEHCTGCQTCIDACPIYLSSGRNDIYRPTYRSEVFRRLVNRHTRPGGRIFAKLQGGDIDLNARTIARLLELSYRCTLCRRCAQACPIGVDNGLIAREIRKLFSMEMGIAPKEIHEKGSMVQLRTGSSTGLNPTALRDNIRFLDDEASEAAGFKVQTQWDKEGADILLMHNAGEILSWPENPMAFAIILTAAGISWTMSSELAGYDAVNYGVWYDDAQFARVAQRQAKVAKGLKVKKMVIGECGHSHKALMVVADRLLTGDLNIPRESSLVLLRDIVRSRLLRLDPSRNNFPVSLHDPCNIVRLMGIVRPQREVLERICPQFREMAPHGVDNYCCGGGSGFAIMSSYNFENWRLSISGRMKLRQVLEAFADRPEPQTQKYLCAPCSNCKGQFRDLFRFYQVWENSRILSGGLAELIVNAMTDIPKPFIQWSGLSS
ncbi:MAG TPA: (Fe-S)-binding protein [Acidobacteriota bacterium]|nr:(Fe-S)-binding protein [Acidobacteriota bacterium]